jgi:hypothetical protein
LGKKTPASFVGYLLIELNYYLRLKKKELTKAPFDFFINNKSINFMAKMKFANFLVQR